MPGPKGPQRVQGGISEPGPNRIPGAPGQSGGTPLIVRMSGISEENCKKDAHCDVKRYAKTANV